MALFFLSLILLIGIRYIFSICIRVSDSKAYAQNRNAGFLDNWFFISMHKAVRDKYVKVERRKVHYHASAKAYYITNIVLHIAFAMIIIGEITAAFWTPFKIWMTKIYTVYYCLLCFALAELGVITHSENCKYYKNLNKRSR